MDMKKLSHVSDILNGQVERGEIAGGTVMVLKEGKEIFRAHAGLADMEKGTRVRDDTIFRLYSMTKPVTAAALMILFDRGKFHFSDNLSWYLPAFEKMTVAKGDEIVPAEKPITIRDLTDMASGLCYPEENTAGRVMGGIFDKIKEESDKGAHICTREFIDRCAEAPLVFEPGTGWEYGIGADVAGALIEVLSGMKYSEFLEKELFGPLGMKDTGFYVPEEKQHRLSQIYLFNEETKKLEVPNWQHLGLRGFFKEKPDFESGGAGLVSTAEDYSRFASMLINDGVFQGQRILSRNAINYMTSPHLTEGQMKYYNWDQCAGYSYGCFNRVLVDRVKAGGSGNIGEYGWDGWTGTNFVNDPVDKITLIYMIQRCGGFGIRPAALMKQIIYSALG